MKIKHKVNLLIVILKIIMTLLIVASVNFVVGQALEEEMQDRDLAITELLASEIANPLLDEDDLRVQEIIDDLKRQNADVRYVYVVGFDGTVVAHTFKDGFPVELVTANPIPSGEDDAIQIRSAEGGSIQDVGVRVLEGMDAKIYIGFSRVHLFESIARTTGTILGIAAMVLLFGILLNSFLMRRMIKPIEALVEGTKRVGDGDLDFRIDVTSRDELGTLTESFNQMTAERKRAGEALHIERDNLINILESMADGVYIVNQQYDIQYVNPVLKKDFDSFDGRKCYKYFHDRDEVCPWCKNQDVLAGKTVRWEWYSFKNQRTYDLIDTPLKNPDGSISKLEIFRDITERKKTEDQVKASLKEKEVLLREIHHRVKNNLQVVSSLLNMQARAAKDKDVQDALSESINRINAMALIHSHLYEDSDLAEINMKKFVDRLLGQLQSYQFGDTRIARVVRVDDYPFPISVAVPVGLIINELLSNALKHAFRGRDEGKIEVSLTASDDGRGNLTVSDDGAGLPRGFDITESKTLGLRLVKILTEDQLQGTLEVTGEGGATFKIEFGIEDDADAGGVSCN